MQAPDWTPRAAALPFDGRAFIDGAFAETDAAAALQTHNPADGQPALRFAAAGAEGVNRAVASARAAFDDGRWARLGPRARRQALLALADGIEADGESLALCDVLDVGKPISGALFEVRIAAAFIRYYAEALDKHPTGVVAPSCAQSMEVQVRRPRGVVVAITPWNYPLVNTCLKIGPALAAGNSVIVKPSSVSPRSAERLAALALKAGVPPGVLNVVQGNAATGDALVRHAGVDMVTFTGSTPTGRALMAAAGGSSLKPMLLECGGKNREFVLGDMASSDLDGVAMNIVMGAFANCGQLCVARSALYLHKDVYDALLDRIVGVAGSLRAGLPLDAATRYGAMATARQRDIALRCVEAGLAQGGQLVVDGRRVQGLPEGGFWLQPSVFTGLSPDSPLQHEEIFGPVLTVNRFDSVDEVLAIANRGDYGLAATLWTRDIKHAGDISSRMQVGKVKVMATPVPTEGAGLSQSAEPARQSGFGVEGGLKGMESYMRQQVVEYAFG